MPAPTSGDIAIVGLSCRFPGDAASPSGFWELLKNGRSGFSETTDRYNADAFYHPIGGGSRQNVIPTKGGYFLKENLFVFDAAFFNITATEAMALDPRQRIALEVAYEALENAGLSLQKVAGTQTACFMGSSMSDYRDAVSRDFQNFPKYHILGVSDEMISNRISHFLDIHGPSATVQTACSSSLVATHLACQSLRSGESEMALAGGVGLILGTDGTMHLSNLGFLSTKGHSRSFDEDASGYGRGEGCGVLVLKRLETAVRDGDTIRAVIRASGVNSDGWTQGVTMPSLEAQASLIKYVYESNGLDYGSTQYVEAHGTGTKVGDPIETGAIHRTIGQSKSLSTRKKLYIGSVKPNIGHLEAAAGVASIIKGVLALERGLIPPSINFSKPNPQIPLDEWNMVVPTKLTPWPAAHVKRMSVSGFGMGGTNAHVVMEAYNVQQAASSLRGHARNGIVPSQTSRKRLFVLSSHDKAGFQRISKALVQHMDTLGSAATSPAYLANLAHTLAVARSGLVWKAALLAENAPELREQLLTDVGENATRTPSSPPRIGFVFTGQGAQWARMGIELLERRVFSESVARSTEFLREMGCEWDPVAELSRGAKESRLGVPEISQPICSVLQIALVDELRSWGVTPSKVVGHSSGEIAAAYTIGALSHRDALAAAYFRGTASAGLRKKQSTIGGMMAVGCSRDDAQKLMKETGLKATVACVNSPSNVTISGDATMLDALRAILDERGIFARRLKVDVAYHSSHMHLCSAEYYHSISDLGHDSHIAGDHHGDNPDGQKQRITMVSSVTGSEIDPEHIAPYYWIQNLISPVLFTDAVKELVSPADGSGSKTLDLLIEIGPHSALGGPVEQILSSIGITDVEYRSAITRGKSALETSLALAAELFSQGVPLNIAHANGDGDANARLLTDLPPYPWNHAEKFRADSRMQRELTAQQFPTKGLIGSQMPRMDESERVWRGFIRLNDEPWLRGHTVGSTVLFPGAGMISIVLEAAQQIVEAGKTPLSFKLRDVSFLTAMTLPEDVATEVTVHLRPHLLATSGSTPSAWWEFTVSSCTGPTGQLRNNCRGLVSILYDESRSLHMALEDARIDAARIAEYKTMLSELPAAVTNDFFYSRMARSGLPYGDVFKGVENCRPGAGKTVYDVNITDIGETFTRGKLARPFLVHAAALDAVLQGWLGSTTSADGDGSDFGFTTPMVPSAIGELEVAVDIPGDVGYRLPSVCRSHRHGFTDFSADINLFDKELSRVVLSVGDFRTAPLELEDAGVDDGGVTVDPADIAAEVRWNYALDLLKPEEVSKAVSEAGAADEKLIQLIQLAIHQHPAVNVVELVPSFKELANTLVTRLPNGTILPAQVRYAVVDDTKVASTDIPENLLGQPFTLGALDAPGPAEIAAADLVIIPYQVSNKGLASVLERLTRADIKPGASVVITASSGDIDEVASPALKAKGFRASISIPGDAQSPGLVLYKVTGLTNGHTNGHPDGHANGLTNEEVVILEPLTSSPEAQLLSDQLQDTLIVQGYSVTIKKGVSETSPTANKTFISFLELETPFLDNLSESDFESLRALLVGAERLLWITAGDNPSFGLVDGLARCVNNEVATTRFQVLHLSSLDGPGLQHGASLALRILQSADKTADNEFREHSGLLQVQRIYQSPIENSNIRRHLEDSIELTPLDDNNARFRLTIGKPGLLDTLHFVREEISVDSPEPLDENEIELDVKATGVNFRDVMASMGLVPITELGQEASGVVLAAGSKAAEQFKPGDRVSTVSVGGTHATRTRCDARVTAKIPDSMSFEEGAAAPMVHATAYFSLVKLAKLRQGQSVLIHAAAGGVGQAAIQLAKHLGLVIYTTVGADDKRRLLADRYGIPDEHIFNSRDSSFAKGIRRVTDGRGVDCVLNSLSGELLRVSWTCLATFGTFVEIGLRDITDNTRLDMRPFRNSATFTYLDIPTLIRENPADLGTALAAVFTLFHSGILQVPHPLTIYPAGEAQEAFRLMQQGKHRGKLVLSFNTPSKAPVLHKAASSLRLDPTATYLLVGGLGGLGRTLAREFVSSGARHIAILSRSGTTNPSSLSFLQTLTSLGATVKIYATDVADTSSFHATMAQITTDLPPIKGVVQLAMVLRDALLETMSFADWSAPLQAKVHGTLNLHNYFHRATHPPLDFMVLCSSISGVCGNPGQAQYDAGNAFQDALAHHRRDDTISLNLGIMRDAGVIAAGVQHNFSVWEDALGIRAPVFLALIKSAVNGLIHRRGSIPSQIAVGLGTADILAAHNLPPPPWLADPRFAPLAVASALPSSSQTNTTNNNNTTVSLAARLAEAKGDTTAVSSLITGALVHKVAEILRIPPSEVDAGRPMYSYGVDSLVALEVRNWIARELKASVALLEILAAVPMHVFAGQIAGKSKLVGGGS
ncbi:hypothetical protein B0T22DRAFT_427611 [Podospora appendiculata]|uniref:Polyketide synthase n=1 Tax=Podospora appendiculata TaxID=314037 RepID=A0AAE1CD90_9PEZI|nr:hypothetical protein B0T22DRAFT_427611 [Podospora appendiculata]